MAGPELKGTFGAVSSTHWLATQSAMASPTARAMRV